MIPIADIRNRFLSFFEKRQHAIIPSASLVPRNDPSVLFTTAGMQPLVPYLLGQSHPQGVRLASCQKCVRTGDIEEVGDNRHLTFFEMLGNWSLGDYFKAEAIEWSYTFLTSPEEGLGLDPNRLYVTVFAGDEHAPKDTEAATLWKRFVPEHRIYYLPAKNNWWSPGDNGPCGPDTEMFYDITGTLGDLSHEAFVAADEAGMVVEIWNDVFMQYEKRAGEVVGKLAQHNVDTGSGLERIACVVQGKQTVFETDVFAPVMALLEEHATTYQQRSARIIADHIRAAVFLLGDGVVPGNKDQGYILRRLIRRSVNEARTLGVAQDTLQRVAQHFQMQYQSQYPEVGTSSVQELLSVEIQKFEKTIEQGMKAFAKGTDPFILATTYGFPIELTEELARAAGVVIDRAHFDTQMQAHQDASRKGADQKFKGGLAHTGEETTKLHTAHHLLLAALQHVLGPTVKQRGSNITSDRLRIDFSFDRKLTDEEKEQVTTLVNQWISADLPVTCLTLPKHEAEHMGAQMEFGTKYPDVVSVYIIGDHEGIPVSKEFCGGPHVARTGVLGTFQIQKEEAVASGIRRIKAVLV